MLKKNAKIGDIVWFIDYSGTYKPYKKKIKKTRIVDISDFYEGNKKDVIIHTDVKQNPKDIFQSSCFDKENLFNSRQEVINYMKSIIEKEIDDCQLEIEKKQKYLKGLKEEIKLIDDL